MIRESFVTDCDVFESCRELSFTCVPYIILKTNTFLMPHVVPKPSGTNMRHDNSIERSNQRFNSLYEKVAQDKKSDLDYFQKDSVFWEFNSYTPFNSEPEKDALFKLKSVIPPRDDYRERISRTRTIVTSEGT